MAILPNRKRHDVPDPGRSFTCKHCGQKHGAIYAKDVCADCWNKQKR
jgi:hypothetical protein